MPRKAKVSKSASDPTQGDLSNDAATGGRAELRARILGELTPTAMQDPTKSTMLLGGDDVLEPPENPVDMYKIYQLSAFLESIIEAVVTNSYAAGYTLEAVLPLERTEGKKAVHAGLLWQKANESFSKGADIDSLDVTEEEVEKEIERLTKRAELEHVWAKSFFDSVVPDMPWRMFCSLTGQDLEVTGNGYWEIVRDANGIIARLSWLAALYTRALRQGQEFIPYQRWIKDSAISWKLQNTQRRFRRYVLTDGTRVIAYFKEYGDPRVLSRSTGKFYSTLEELQSSEEEIAAANNATPLAATEVLHFKVPYGGSTVYGKPRASGAFPALIGSRDNDEENLKVMSDSDVPSLMLMISGGIMAAKSFERLETQIKERGKGRKGIMLIEAVSPVKGAAAASMQPTIKVERTKKEQTDDALGQKYDARNEEKARGVFRLPQVALGKSNGETRQTVPEMTRFAEDQVYQPKKQLFDDVINETILAERRVLLWRYSTQSAQPRDPVSRAEVLKVLVDAGVLSPNEARDLAQSIFSKQLPDLDALWASLPPRIMTNLLQTKNQELAAILLGNDRESFNTLADTVRKMLGFDGESGSRADEEEEEEESEGNEAKAKKAKVKVKDEEDAS